jgi:hypothetical protein
MAARKRAKQTPPADKAGDSVSETKEEPVKTEEPKEEPVKTEEPKEESKGPRVAKGKALSLPGGIKSEGEKIAPSDFSGDEKQRSAAFAACVKKGHIEL